MQEENDNGMKSQDEKFESIFMSRMLKERIIFMSSDVNAESARKVISQLLLYDATDKTKPIYFFINSPGGEIYSGMAIFDMIQFIDSEVVTIATGLTASMGTVLLMSGAKGKRFATRHARLMIHQPLGGFRGAAADIDIQAQEILFLKDMIIEMLMENTGQSKEKIEKDINRNFWMSATDSKDYGLVDHVVSTRSDLLATLGLSRDTDAEDE